MKKKLLFVLLAICMVMSFAITVAAEENTSGSELITGSGTEADPFVISSVEGLIAFRDSVNAGETTYNAEGVYVALGANIDLSGVDWSVNIGDDCNATFDGIFDGKGYTISNLTAVETAQKADEYVCGGLFGAIYGDAVIKNLVIENVSINTGDFTGNNVGAVVGFVYNGKGSIENVTVCGKIEINAKEIYGVGAIVGYSYYNKDFTIDNCKVIADKDSYINGTGVGAIVGYSSGDIINNSEVSGIAIEGKGLLGGIAGLAINTSSINGAKVENVTFTITNPNWINGTGIAVGTMVNNGLVVSNVTYANVTGADTVVGSVYTEKPTSVVPAVLVRVGDAYYNTLADAIAAVVDGGTITLINDITIDETMAVNSGGTWYEGVYYEGDKSFTIDLNGKKITNTSAVNDYLFLFKNVGTKANVINIVNGTLEATSSAYCALCTSSGSTQQITLNLTNVAVIGGNSNGSVIKVRGGTVLNVNGGTVITGKDSYLGIEAVASTVNFYDGAKIYQNGTTSYNGCLIGVASGATVNVYGGTGVGVGGGLIAMTSGGTINVYGGTWTANTDGTYANSNKSVLIAQSGSGAKSVINVYDGTFNGGYNCYGEKVGDAQINLFGGIFNSNPESYCAKGYVAKSYNSNYKVEKLISGSGTETDPYVISSVEALIFFRDSVNAGETTYNAEGVYVALGANIDLSGVDWSVNIGDDCNATFDGIFDGKGYIISNLTATETAQKSDVYVCTGLFGAIYGDAVVKNFTLENVSINVGEFTGNNVAAVVGFVYAGTGSIENVTVCGKIEINAVGVYGVGAIVGYSYNSFGFDIKNCKVVGDADSYINASSGLGGIIGYCNGAVIEGCEVSGISLEALGLVGGVAGITVTSTSIGGVKVENVILNATSPVWVNATGIAVGTISSTGLVVTNVNYTNVNGADTLVGSVYAEKPSEVVPAVEVLVNGAYYGTLANALANVKAGDVIALVKDVEVSAFLTVAKGNSVTLDLNGYTISGVDTTTANFGLIQNNGTLVINDTVGTGKIVVSATVNSGWNRYSAAISNNPGASLTVNGGTIEHLGGTDMAYGIDSLTNGNTTSVEVVINGGTVKSTYRGIRQFLNGYGANNTLIINGGTVEGANKSLFFHAPSGTKPSTGTLVVGENAVLNGDVYLFVTAGSTIWDVEVSIAVAALTEGSEIITGNVPSQYVVEETNGTVVVRELGNEAKITGAAVKLGADLSIKYLVDVLDATILENGNLFIEFVIGGETVIVTEYTVEDGKYAFILKGIAPQQMADVITATVKVGETVYAVKDNYSIKQNCANLLAKTAAELGISEAKYEAMKTLIADLLYYEYRTYLAGFP